MRNKSLNKLTLSAVFLALGLLLPFLTGQLQSFGNMLLPMHLPVMLCGLICGWQYGLLIGFITPLLRSMIFGMPPLLPSAFSMAFELAAYGAVIGIVYILFKRKTYSIFIALFTSMIMGRIIWAAASTIFYSLAGKEFTFQIFITQALVNAVPGIILQIILIPSVIILLKKTKVIKYD